MPLCMISRVLLAVFLRAFAALSNPAGPRLEGDSARLTPPGAGEEPSINGIPDPPNPWPDGLPTFSSIPGCVEDGEPSEACATALNFSTRGSIYIDNNCGPNQNAFLNWAAKDAFKLAKGAVGWNSDSANTGGIPTAEYYMGPDWEQYKDRIDANIKRAGEFKDGSNYYVRIHCNDPKGLCKKGKKGDKTIGGYAWERVRWFWWNSYHISMCEPFYSEPHLRQVEEMLANILKAHGRQAFIDKAKDLLWLHSSGGKFLHEMFHLDNLIGVPHITDEEVTPDGDNIIWAYAPKRVHQLATKVPPGPRNYGGAQRSSTNADSYAMMITAMYWWKVNKYPFPGDGKDEGPHNFLGIDQSVKKRDDIPPPSDDLGELTKDNSVIVHLGQTDDPNANFEEAWEKVANLDNYDFDSDI